MNPDVAYVWRQILNHVSLFFTAEARAHLEGDTVRFLSWDEAQRSTGSHLVIPIDIPASVDPESPYTVPFNGTELTLWNRLPRPSTPNWEPIPCETRPLWYRHRTGTLLPAWNLYGTLFGLLTFQEELRSSQRDGHGRFLASYSPRYRRGLLEVPAFNEAVAALVDACTALDTDAEPQLRLGPALRPPAIVLSHDCDVLYGNDLWTQGVRAYRVFQPLARARAPRLGQLWWMGRNAVTPRRYYFDNLTGMVDLERSFGYRSTFYALNGTGGRFGARNGTRGLDELAAMVPDGWDLGMHYNYDTFLNRDRFQAQLDQLKHFTSKDMVSGRAHYLRFDPERSLPFLESCGIEVDESAGYSDGLGYRCGIGGCFEAYDTTARTPRAIVEVPMVIMDTTLVIQYAEVAIATVRRMLTHLQHVGGALSVIFHPGVFHNPEFPEMLGIYHRILVECRRVGARALTARDLVNALQRN